MPKIRLGGSHRHYTLLQVNTKVWPPAEHRALPLALLTTALVHFYLPIELIFMTIFLSPCDVNSFLSFLNHQDNNTLSFQV